jgi:hypothetical protein
MTIDEQHVVLSALVDREPVDPEALATALEDPAGRRALVDFIRLRVELQRDDAGAGEVGGTPAGCDATFAPAQMAARRGGAAAAGDRCRERVVDWRLVEAGTTTDSRPSGVFHAGRGLE